MNITKFLEELKTLGKPGPGFKPHKQILLLAVIRLIKKGKIQSNHVFYNETLKEEFKNLLIEYGSIEDRDRPYNPFFHLGNSSFWKLVPNSGFESELKNIQSITGPTMLMQLINFAELSEFFFTTLQDSKLYYAIETLLLECIISGRNNPKNKNTNTSRSNHATLHRIVFSNFSESNRNPFVDYLNSLQLLNASNENALAEYQARNPFFPQIHVAHQITQSIIKELLNPSGRQVILTGHAGDGKTTIALDVYKKLAKLPPDQPLTQPLNPREDLPGRNITILKDLSERRRQEDTAFMQEIFSNKRRFLIISNTGALLDLFKFHAKTFGVSAAQMESNVLDVISNEKGEALLKLGSTDFLVFNLAHIDNLDMARQIFSRMIAPERWAVCNGLACRSNCPICMNVDLINHRKEIIFDRLFLAYRRMYEYGTRLTLRQLTEHLAYLITSGLEEKDLGEMRQKKATPLKAEFMFFNRFFGDNGKEDHIGAKQMRAVREVREQRFGERPCPTWERKLWLRLRDRNFSIGVEDCEEEFELLRVHGSGPGSSSKPGLTPDQAREQVRRMLYFLYDFNDNDRSYLSNFLNSPSVLRWQEWQKKGTLLEMQEKNILEQRIFHVLQEHCTGVRLPEGLKGHDRRLYITLSRRKSEIRQSAQVVVAQVDWSNEIVLKLVERDNAGGNFRTDLELQGIRRLQSASLVLTLPFLDYMVMRHFGELGKTLKAAYVERLERFKAQIQELAKETQTQVMLVRLKTDHTFRRQHYAVTAGKLEVSDVL